MSAPQRPCSVTAEIEYYRRRAAELETAIRDLLRCLDEQRPEIVDKIRGMRGLVS